MQKKDNFEIDRENNLVLVAVNPKLFSVSAIQNAAYFLLDRAFVVLDGNPETQVVVSLRPRGKESLEELARLFNDELLSCAVNLEQSRKTEKLRNEIIKQAFAAHSGGAEK